MKFIIHTLITLNEYIYAAYYISKLFWGKVQRYWRKNWRRLIFFLNCLKGNFSMFHMDSMDSMVRALQPTAYKRPTMYFYQAIPTVNVRPMKVLHCLADVFVVEPPALFLWLFPIIMHNRDSPKGSRCCRKTLLEMQLSQRRRLMFDECSVGVQKTFASCSPKGFQCQG